MNLGWFYESAIDFNYLIIAINVQWQTQKQKTNKMIYGEVI